MKPSTARIEWQVPIGAMGASVASRSQTLINGHARAATQTLDHQHGLDLVPVTPIPSPSLLGAAESDLPH